MRQLFFMLSLWLAAISTFAQQVTVRDVFKLMPDSIVPYLTENNRLDLLDFIDSKMTAEVTNSLGGKSVMTKLSERHLSLRLSEASTMDLLLLPVSQPVDSTSQLICLIRTYGADVCESSIQFFSAKWRQLPTNQYIDLPLEMFVAEVNSDQSSLTLTFLHQLDVPANEEQDKLQKQLMSFKWEEKYVIER